MKKTTNMKSVIAIALFAVLTMAFTPAAKAAEETPFVPVELKLIGNIKNQPVFQLNIMSTVEENEFTVSIVDEYGNNLYRQTVKGDSISKKFLLNTDEIGNGTLRFEITGTKSNKTVVYEINRSSRVVDEMVVNKVK